MKIKVTLIIASLFGPFANAQLLPPLPPTQRTEVRQVSDPAMVMQPGRTRIELFPSQTVVVARNRAGTMVMSQKASSASGRISPSEPVLVFNHAYQQYGYATGEIAFKFKGRKSVESVRSIVPGAKTVGNQFYVVNVGTSAEILRVTQQLKSRADVDWVIPTVRYLPLASQARE
jgi:hypothetical protein